MTKHSLWTVVVCVAFVTLSTLAAAKRLPPKPVTPVVANGVQYSATGDGRVQYVTAAEISSGRELWQTKVFSTPINSSLEEDVQWVFITDLKLMENSLLVRDEKARCYSVDLRTRHVHTASCGRAFARGEPESR